MKFLLKTITLVVFSVAIISLSPAAKVFAEEAQNKAQIEKHQIENPAQVNPLELVNNPGSFMNQEIKIQAQFHKFSTLGLDYDRAMRSSKDYIAVLIKRPDVSDKYTIPLSELKLIIKRDQAEELMDMESGDKVVITGKVFSSALNDPWVDIYELNSIEPKAADNKKLGQKAGK